MWRHLYGCEKPHFRHRKKLLLLLWFIISIVIAKSFVDPAKINQFAIEPRNVTEFQSSVSIQCTGVGNPPPTVTIADPSDMTVSQNGSVTLNSVSRHSAGLYTCTADNGIGSSVSRTADLVVYCMYYIWLLLCRFSFNSLDEHSFSCTNMYVKCCQSVHRLGKVPFINLLHSITDIYMK